MPLTNQKKYLTEWVKLPNQDINCLQNKLNEQTKQLNMALDKLNRIEINGQ